MLARRRTRGTLVPALGLALVVAVPALAAGPPTFQPRQDTQAAPVRPGAAPVQERETGLKRATTGPALKLDRNTLRKLDTLPRDQMLDVAGKKMTAGEYKAKLRENQQAAAARVRSMRAGPSANVDAMQAQLDKAQASRVDAANAKVAAELAKVKKSEARRRSSPRFNAIRKEAAEIQGRMKNGTATPQDEARAKQLFEEYQRLQ